METSPVVWQPGKIQIRMSNGNSRPGQRQERATRNVNIAHCGDDHDAVPVNRTN